MKSEYHFYRPWLLSAIIAVSLGIGACTHCPDKVMDQIKGNIPAWETKNDGFDLRGWKYQSVVSEESKETYRYYHMPSKTPNAPKLVLIHGMFLDGRTFIKFGPLADQYELIALELPYDSSFYKGKISDFPLLLQDFLDAMAIEQMMLGGVSLGGQIAMFYMSQTPQTEVQGLVLIATDTPQNEKDLKRDVGRAQKVLKITKGEDRKMLCLLSKMVKRQKSSAAAQDPELQKIFAIKPASFYREILQISYDMHQVTPFHKIDAPTVIILGDEDSAVPFDSAKELVHLIPGAKLEVIEGGAHSMAYTQSDQIIERIRKHFPDGPINP